MVLTAQYADIENCAKKLYVELQEKRWNTRKEFALMLASKPRYKDFAPILFKMLDNQDYSDVIWKKLKPSGDEKFIQAEGEEVA